MKIAVGSTNQVKVNAVKELAPQYDHLANAEVLSVSVPSNVSEQPKSIGETVQGAMNRAKAAREGCDLGFGIESGLIEVPHTKTGMMDVCVCVIFDGEEYHIGLSSAFECPPKVMELVHGEGLDLNQAFHKAGMTDNPKVGSAEGAIGLLTKGRVTRKDYTKQAILMAMIHLENAKFYKR
jgi:inosine/xanthosine triphosphatase